MDSFFLCDGQEAGLAMLNVAGNVFLGEYARHDAGTSYLAA